MPHTPIHPAHRQEIIRLAQEAFFAEVMRHMPPGTTGDFSPEAQQAFDAAADMALTQLEHNVPPKAYYVLHKVEWHPGLSDRGLVSPPDSAHYLEVNDTRANRADILSIGTADQIREALDGDLMMDEED